MKGLTSLFSSSNLGQNDISPASGLYWVSGIIEELGISWWWVDMFVCLFVCVITKWFLNKTTWYWFCKGKENHKKMFPKGGKAPQTEIEDVLCVLSQNYQHFFKKYYNYLEVNCLRNSKWKWHWNFGKPSGSWDIDQNRQNVILINRELLICKMDSFCNGKTSNVASLSWWLSGSLHISSVLMKSEPRLTKARLA